MQRFFPLSQHRFCRWTRTPALTTLAVLFAAVCCSSEGDSEDGNGATVPASTAPAGANSPSPAVGAGASGGVDPAQPPGSGTGDVAEPDGTTSPSTSDDAAVTDDSPVMEPAAGETDGASVPDDETTTGETVDDSTVGDDDSMPDVGADDDAVTDGMGLTDDEATTDDMMMSDDGAVTDDMTTDDGTDVGDLEPFSFFVTSYEAIERLSGSPDGFGGDLRYGEEHGLLGADKICTEVAEFSMPGSSAKVWRAFLSVVEGPDGGQIDAIDRIGEGPWYDRNGRIVAETLDALANTRPEGAHPEIVNDLPNEYGVPNHAPDPLAGEIDNHHVLTGSNEQGRLYSPTATCADWSSTEKSADGRPRIGFSWPAGNRQHWISGQDEGGCLRGVDLDGGGGSDPNVGTVGSGGGYGGIYCFALSP